MSWDAASFEMGAQWHMTPDGQWHPGPSTAPRVVAGHVVKVDPWGVTIADGPPRRAVVKAPAAPSAPRAPGANAEMRSALLAVLDGGSPGWFPARWAVVP